MVLSERSESKGFGLCFPQSESDNAMMVAMYFVYIIRTIDDTLYIGVSGHLGRRIDSHKVGKGAEWTKAHSGARCVYAEPHATRGSARRREAQLKSWT